MLLQRIFASVMLACVGLALWLAYQALFIRTGGTERLRYDRLACGCSAL